MAKKLFNSIFILTLLVFVTGLLVSLPGCFDSDSDSSNNKTKNFNRISSFLICRQIDENCDTDEETVAEIVAASADGNTLIYTDSGQKQIGFVNITDPENPQAAGVFNLPRDTSVREPTSVAVVDGYALAAVNTSANFINTSGVLQVVDITDKTLAASIALGGQPDSIAVSPDKAYAAIVIENERNEDLGSGAPPQLPAGYLVIVNLSGEPTNWTTRSVTFTGLTDMLYQNDPEPEYVDINSDNIAVISLQENNHIVLVDLTNGRVVNHFSAGTETLSAIDTTEEDPALISLTETKRNIRREPDGISWINNTYFATADEGDLVGGARGFTIFNTDGDIVYSPGNSLEHRAVQLGHYPDGRSDAKGNEPENVEYGRFDTTDFLFVASERANLVFVYNVDDPQNPVHKQTLPAGVGPEGVLAIPTRNLLIAASEKDDRGDKFRSVLNIYQYTESKPDYPDIESASRSNDTPIPWGALSGLTAEKESANKIAYTIHDSYYQQSRIFKLDLAGDPAMITEEILIKDTNGVLARLSVVDLPDENVDDDHDSRKDVFDEADLAALINADQTVNLDLEGIALASAGGFWLASEGSGTVGDENRPVNSHNLLLKVSQAGVIERVITLTSTLNNSQLRFGFEGIVEYNGGVYVAFQRAWGVESNPRIGRYDLSSNTWSFAYYRLDDRQSQNGGWVGLSDLALDGGSKIFVLERDNQGGADAVIKRIYSFEPDRVNFVSGGTLNTIDKTRVRDLKADLKQSGGLIPEKVEGLTVTNGEVLIVNDNDGVDDNNGETRLVKISDIALP